LRIALGSASLPVARGGARKAGTDLFRPAVRNRHDAGPVDRRHIQDGESLDRRFPAHGNVSRAGDLGHTSGGAGSLLPVPAAALLRSADDSPDYHGGGVLAVRASDGMAGASDSVRRRTYSVSGRQLFLSGAADSESHRGRGDRIPAGGSAAASRA